MNEPIGLKQRLNGYSSGELDAVEAVAEAEIATRPARGTQEFAETYRHFTLGTPWFHEAWYEAYDNPDLARLYVQGPREHAKTSTVLTYAIRRLAEDHHLRVGIVSGTDGLAMSRFRRFALLTQAPRSPTIR